jgi:hypothetical protein
MGRDPGLPRPSAAQVMMPSSEFVSEADGLIAC